MTPEITTDLANLLERDRIAREARGRALPAGTFHPGAFVPLRLTDADRFYGRFDPETDRGTVIPIGNAAKTSPSNGGQVADRSRFTVGGRRRHPADQDPVNGQGGNTRLTGYDVVEVIVDDPIAPVELTDAELAEARAAIAAHLEREFDRLLTGPPAVEPRPPLVLEPLPSHWPSWRFGA